MGAVVTACLIFGLAFFTANPLQAQSCPGLGSITLNVVPAPEPDISGNPEFCQGSNTTLSVTGGPFSTYAWSGGGGNNPSITVNTPGTYTVTVTNSAGCSGTASQQVTLSPAPAPNITVAPYACNGQFTLDAGAGFDTYNWSNSDNTQSITVNTNGNYTVTVTNAQGCTGTDTQNVSIPAPPVVSITGNLNFCSGSSTLLSATAGFAQYQWTGGSSGSTLSVNTEGTYNVTATDANGCTDEATVTVTEQAFTPPTISGGNVLCPGTTLTLSVDAPGYAGYNWSNGFSTQSISVTTAGVYSVTVSAANGCTGTATANVIPGSTTTTSIIGNLTICAGGSTTLIATGSFQSYDWSNGDNGSIINVDQTGPYTVTVTTTQGCTGTATATVVPGTPPTVSIAGVSGICPGASTTLTAQPGGLSSYTWSNGLTGQSISVDQAGTYSVTATGAPGCTGTASLTVNDLPAPVPNITGPASICSGASAILSVNGFSAYNWSTGQNTPNITVTTGGTYTVVVTAANGCTGSDAFTQAVNPNPLPNIVASTYACNGQLTLDAGAGFSLYQWSNSANTPGITVTTSGNYFVTVTDANGCTGVDNINALIPPAPNVNVTGDAQICDGETGTLSATPGLASYSWSNGLSGSTIQVDQAGLYTVTATDAFGCTDTDDFTVTVEPAPTPVISGPVSICTGSSATFSVAAGFTFYDWSNGGNGPSITVSVAGTYSVTVTAANGCTGTDAITLTLSSSLQPQIVAQPYQCDGQLTLDAGAGFSAYNWSSSGNGQVIDVSTAGNYSVTVSDAGGCTGTDVIAVSIPTPPAVSISGASQFCVGESTDLTASPGFNYLWSTGDNGATITVGNAGTYSVTATDAFGCTATDDVAVSLLPVPTVSIAGPSAICTGNSATFDASGPFIGYVWSTGENTSSITTSVAGFYNVVVTAANGCTASDGIDLQVLAELQPEIAPQPYLCNGQFTLDAGPGFSSYNWSTGANTQTVVAAASDTYTVVVTDASGCTGTDAVAVAIPPAPQVVISGTSTFCQNNNTALDATPGFAAYLWNTGETSASIVAGTGGTFAVTVTDAFGCTDVESIAVTELPLPLPAIAGPAAICEGATATLSVAGSFSLYNWSDGTSGTSIDVTAAGSYTVTVTDTNGCTGTDALQLTVNQNPAAQVTPQPYACDGQITLDAGPGFTNYSWNNTGNTQSIAVANSGNYAVTVTDANGCTASANVDVTVPVLNQVGISGPLQFCQGATTSIFASAGFDTYAWSNGDNTANITTGFTGNFTVTATDALGCTSTAQATLSNFPQPTPVISGPQAVCPGSTATLSVPGAFAAYLWSDGSTTAAVTVQPPAIVGVTVTDANGCTGSANASVDVSNQLAPQIVEQPYQCNSTITLDAGGGFALYSWSNAGNAQTNEVTTSGTYTVTVSDGGACTGTASIQVDIPVTPALAISGPAEICFGQSAELAASPGFLSYLWSNGQSGALISTDQTIPYQVTATDANGCTAVATFTLGLAPVLTPTIDGITSICPGGSTVFTVQGNYTSYNWSNGEITAAITVSQPGNYVVSVSDAAGCTGSAAIDLNLTAGLNPVISQEPYQCDEQITIDAGAGFASYQWSTGQNSAALTITQSGTYEVTVTDASGCSGTASAQVTVPEEILPQVFFINELCPGASITSTVINEENFVAFAWSTGSSDFFSTGIVGGQTYSVTVTSAAGCSYVESFSVALAPVPAPVINIQPYQCNGLLTLDAGSGFATYNWSNGQSGSSITVGQAGTYSVTVTNNLACPGSGSIEAFIPANPVVAISAPSVICAGASAPLAATPGLAQYLWSNGQTGPNTSATQGGNYSVTATDANGCTAVAATVLAVLSPDTTLMESLTCNPAQVGFSVNTLNNLAGCDSVVITQTVLGAALSVTAAVSSNFNGYDLSCADGSDGIATAIPQSGQAPFAYQWSNGSAAATAQNLLAGAYSVTITDASGCSGVATVNLNAPAPVTPTLLASDPTCQNAGTVSVETVTGGAGPYTVRLVQDIGVTNGQEPLEFDALGAGTFTVEITDANGCVAEQSIVLLPPAAIQEFVGDTIEINKGDTITLNPSITIAPLDINWAASSGQLSCNNCLTPSLAPVVTTTVQLDVQGYGECAAAGLYYIIVAGDAQVFIPNVIAPESTDNFSFTVYGDERVVRIRSLQVYDRWGGQMALIQDFVPNDPAQGWDGTYRGKVVQPGVYVYWAEVEFSDGSTEVFEGDVTVLR